ncbi:MAG: DUF4388 domain-containing protein, partial [Thermodesulfobacteriota bacterium]
VVVNRHEMPKKTGEEYYYFYETDNKKHKLDSDYETYDEETNDLSGRIEDTGFAKLLSSFRHKRSFGQLHIESNVKLNIFFSNGLIQYVEYDDPKLRLGHLLVESETISEKDQYSAVEYSKESGLKIGEALIELGKLGKHDLSKILELQFKLKLLNGFRNLEGFYWYKDSEVDEIESDFKIDPLQIIYDAVNLYYVYDPSSYENDIDGIIHTEEEFIHKIHDLNLISNKQFKLASMIKENSSIKYVIDNSLLKEDETFKFLKFLELSELISIERIYADISDAKHTDESVFDPFGESTLIINEKIIKEQFNSDIKKTD